MLGEAAFWGSRTMAHTVYGVPEVSLEYRMFGQWYFSGAPADGYQEFIITESPRNVWLDGVNEWMINWCTELLKDVSRVWKLKKEIYFPQN